MMQMESATTTTMEIMTLVETQQNTLEQTRAVLAEATRYFENTEHTDFLPYNADRIYSLLSVVDRLIYDALPEMEHIVTALQEKHKEENENAEHHQGQA